MTDPGAEVITVTLGDKTFRAGRRTAAHIEWTIAELEREHPGAHLHIIQPCYNDGVGASEGTHDFDGVIDVEIDGLTGLETQTFMRRKGWGDWFRTPAQGFPFHNHAISLGCPGPVGRFIDGGLSLFGRIVATSQIDDYFAHALGLEGDHAPGSDTTWFPPDIESTIFQEALMVTPDDEKTIEAITRRVIREELAAFAKTAGATIKVDDDNNPKTPKISLERELRD